MNQEVNFAQLQHHFNQLFHNTPKEDQLYRTPEKEDIEKIYSEQLIKNASGIPLPTKDNNSPSGQISSSSCLTALALSCSSNS